MTLGWWRPGRAPFLSRAGSLGFCTDVNSGPRRGIWSECPWCVQPLGARRRGPLPPTGVHPAPSSWQDPGREYGLWVGPRTTGLGVRVDHTEDAWRKVWLPGAAPKAVGQLSGRGLRT